MSDPAAPQGEADSVLRPVDGCTQAEARQREAGGRFFGHIAYAQPAPDLIRRGAQDCGLDCGRRPPDGRSDAEDLRKSPRLDVLVQMEDVVGVVLPFERGQPI
jgi:hypothetical protein